MIVGMAGREERSKPQLAHRDRRSFGDGEIDQLGPAGGGEAGFRPAERPKAARPRYVVGMDMGFERACEPEAQAVDDVEIALDRLQNGIDQHRLARLLAADQIGVGRGSRLEQLTEDHAAAPCPVAAS